jgi:hypothetical protein
MSASTTVKLNLDNDAYEIFKATRIIHCQAFGCQHHSINFDRLGGHAECTLKRVYIIENGACQQFAAKETGTA